MKHKVFSSRLSRIPALILNLDHRNKNECWRMDNTHLPILDTDWVSLLTCPRHFFSHYVGWDKMKTNYYKPTKRRQMSNQWPTETINDTLWLQLRLFNIKAEFPRAQNVIIVIILKAPVYFDIGLVLISYWMETKTASARILLSYIGWQ